MKRKHSVRATQYPALPHSWNVKNWPTSVFPGDSGQARYLIRVHKSELLKAGALVRVGRALCVFGDPFSRWLQRTAHRVPDYQIAPNRSRDNGGLAV